MDDTWSDDVMTSESFRAKDIGLKTQKKLLSRMSNKTTVKMFIDEKSGNILDNTYRLFKQYTGNKKEAEKLIKCIVKTIVKIGILFRNNQFDSNEMKIAYKLRSNFHKVIMTVVSFYELEFSYDYAYLSLLLNDMHTNLRFLVQNHLTEKSLGRIDHVFQFAVKKEFSDAVFSRSSRYSDVMDKLIIDLQRLADESI